MRPIPLSPSASLVLLEGVFIVAFLLPIIVSVADVGTHVRKRFGLAFIIGVAGESFVQSSPLVWGAGGQGRRVGVDAARRLQGKGRQ